MHANLRYNVVQDGGFVAQFIVVIKIHCWSSMSRRGVELVDPLLALQFNSLTLWFRSTFALRILDRATLRGISLCLKYLFIQMGLFGFSCRPRGNTYICNATSKQHWEEEG